MSKLKTILVVDDSDDTREIAKISLENVGGYEVQAVDSGELALAVYQRFSPDVVLLDVVMPGTSGLMTARELRELDKDVRIIFLTGRAEREEVETYLAMGAIGVITKPFDAMKLSEGVENIWRGGT